VAVRVVKDDTDTVSVFIMTIDRSSISKGGDKDTDLLDDWDMLYVSHGTRFYSSTVSKRVIE